MHYFLLADTTAPLTCGPRYAASFSSVSPGLTRELGWRVVASKRPSLHVTHT
jgi:hypothetical protein